MTAIDHCLSSWVRIAARPAANSPALFLDRDGTIIENVAYLSDPGAVALIPGTIETLRAFRTAGFAIVIVTNQSGVARGLITPAQYRAVDAYVLERLGSGLVDATYACPFHPDGRGSYGGNHLWRKPNGGMLKAAAEDLQLDIAQSVMVGDSLTDIMAAANAGVGRAIHVMTGHGASERAGVEQWATHRNRNIPRVECVASIAEITPAGFA